MSMTMKKISTSVLFFIAFVATSAIPAATVAALATTSAAIVKKTKIGNLNKTVWGGMTSSGADQKALESGAAWFLGEATVEYCIQIAERQTVNEAQVEQVFRFSLDTWQSYMSENTQFPLADEKPSLNFHKVSCAANPPLKIYVGVTNPEIEKAKEFFEKPYAMAHRQSYDMKARRGTGFIWFAPNGKTKDEFPQWDLPYNLQGMMLHEMGHVFGCEHVDNTIMDPDLISKLQMAASDDKDWAEYGKFYLSRIDHHQFLHSHLDKPFYLKGVINDYRVEESQRLFELLTGRKSKGDIVASVDHKGGPLTLTLKDDLGQVSFEILLPRPNSARFGKPVALFKVAYWKSETESVATSVSPTGTSTMTAIKSKTGKDFPIQVNINIDEIGWPVTIKILEPGDVLMKSLFSSNLWMTAGLPPIKHEMYLEMKSSFDSVKN